MLVCGIQRCRGRATALRGHISLPLFRNAYFLIASSVLSSALGFPFWALAARLYGAGTVGRASALLSAMAVVAGVAALGLPSVLVRYLPSSGAQARRYVFRSYAIAAVGGLVLGALAAALTGVWSPSLRFVSTDSPWFALFVLGTAISAISTLQDSVLTGLREARWVPLENVFASVVKIGLIVVLARSYAHAGVVISWVVALVASLVPVNAAIFVKFLPQFIDQHRLRAQTWVSRDVRRLVVGNYVGDLASLVITFSLPVIVLDLSGARQAGYFYVPWMLSLAMRFIAQNMSTSMTVETSMSEESRSANLRDVVRTLLWLLLPLVAVVVIVAPYLLDVFGPGYSRAGTSAVRILALGILPHAVAMLGLGIARLRHDGRFVAAIQTADAVTMVAVTFILVPMIGIEGAALAWLTAQTVAALLSVGTVWKVFRPGIDRVDPAAS
jgi:O-antigen/teichoic acid export membrane protein